MSSDPVPILGLPLEGFLAAAKARGAFRSMVPQIGRAHV